MAATHLLSPADILWKTLKDYGYDAESIFLEEGIDREMILTPGVRITHAAVESLWSAVAELIEDPCFGLHAEKFWHPSHFNALGHAWLASGTLREALIRAVRYINIIGEDREKRLEDRAEGLTVILSSSLEVPALMDLSMSILMSACRLNYGPDLDPVDVRFIHPEPSCAEEYDLYFNAPVKFNADSDSLTLPADAVDKRLPIGNPHLAKLNDQYIFRYLANLDRNNIVQRVKGVIIDLLPSGGVSDEKAAQKLNLSTRSLQRKLQTNRTTFQTLLEEVRQELAEGYIHDSTISLMEIAFVLGFSEYSSFSRAYKRWTGISPSEVRKSEQNIQEQK
jgi:AraC-like DNA-binding protein